MGRELVSDLRDSSLLHPSVTDTPPSRGSHGTYGIKIHVRKGILLQTQGGFREGILEIKRHEEREGSYLVRSVGVVERKEGG